MCFRGLGHKKFVYTLYGLGIFFCVCLFNGCAARPLSYVHPTADLSYIKNVAIVPPKNLTKEKGVSYRVMDMIAAEILRRGVFNVMEFGEVIKVLREEGFNEKDGIFSKKMAERAGKRLHVQAFIVGSVGVYGMVANSRDPYPEVALSLRLIDARSYSILWESTYSVKGGTILDRLFGIGKKTPEELCREALSEMFDTLFDALS
ncbi:MAG: hypothetical protein Q9M37_03575 [Desulfonauticus sp.]|nr:hypothetical protein [Desulfonauticus sp.]